MHIAMILFFLQVPILFLMPTLAVPAVKVSMCRLKPTVQSLGSSFIGSEWGFLHATLSSDKTMATASEPNKRVQI
ncbi:hypothetical protein SERLA73DRAFT_132132 [Serpula lacrymans var. lacrymans S7.3]|uniref:Secreted protein n=2 Tax=Serpula lacrymans var. lacrymans TaxID=341189 RepID=F8PR29_SERL3|nr:uncharacterized protein SERLADRAFT_381956 [Serpula lacrymans var. lacrymans S7.9]EGO01686.1 hypothetical protein SERLA73DRAFT_132132 [Serpula lacrymans var. lacrymans S7.3]EGO27328.1 hypothetical protein SERLADRAFT_381956 [Serpula lacrymans var. lacrymans S7.9]